MATGGVLRNSKASRGKLTRGMEEPAQAAVPPRPGVGALHGTGPLLR